VYQSVIEKTRGLALRTQAIGTAVARAGGAMSFENQQQQVGDGSDSLLQEQQEVVGQQQQMQLQTVAVG
jgi:translation initiation factor 3 subunit E